MFTRAINELIKIKNVRCLSNQFSRYIDVSEEVQHALKNNLPVLALESTIITHGMPMPNNLQCAQLVEKTVREQGVTPATIAILNGRITIGLTTSQLTQLADITSHRPPAVKTSRRDLAAVVSRRLTGGTTVSATVAICTAVGLPVFATGGIGGVHRNGESTWDVSADLTELGRSPVAVVSSGVKSILDVGRTLEYLETQGVLVATLEADSSAFPAFYTRDSGHTAPHHVTCARDAALIVHTARQLQLGSGMLFAVPVPAEHALPAAEIGRVIEEALEAAKVDGVIGKAVTPYLLARVGEATAGRALQTNIALVQNNAKMGAKIAKELSLLEREEAVPTSSSTKTGVQHGGIILEKNRPVIIGGSVLDRCAALIDDDMVKIDGRIHDVRMTENPGGVARNICEALTKLSGRKPVFLSVVGNDESGKILRNSVGDCDDQMISLEDGRSAQCTVILDPKGECRFLLGDMEIHKRITPKMVARLENFIKDSPILVFDGNLPVESMNTALELAGKYNIPVLFEPTDVLISKKPFHTNNWNAIKIITPNLNELKQICESFDINSNAGESKTKLEQAAVLGAQVAQHVPLVIVTLAEEGILLLRRNSSSVTLNDFRTTGDVQIRHYPVQRDVPVLNVSGAGDCFTAGLITGLLHDFNETQCVSLGFEAALAALQSQNTVPNQFLDSKLIMKNSLKFTTVV